MKRRGSVALLFLASTADAFVTPRQTISGSSALYMAKKATKRKKTAKTSSAGGFGAPATVAKKKKNASNNDDYAIFPALEPGVKETLVPSPDDPEDPAGELPNEIYQRLDQIYGFPEFNYETKRKEEEAEGTSLSFEDMLNGNFEEEEDDNERSTATDEFQIEQLPPFEKFNVLHVDPLVLQVEDFFEPEECAAYVDMPFNLKKDDIFKTGSLTVGKDDKSKAQRTSTTWFNHYKNVPELMAKASRLLGLEGIDQWEEPQTVRYRRNEKFTWHLDALGPNELNTSKGGQRVCTLLVYHTDLGEDEGGATVFRDLRDKNGERLKVRPKKGSALLFFPAAGGIPNTPLDIRTLHCGESVANHAEQDKWISQLWLRATPNVYQPTAPAGNAHSSAVEAISEYCNRSFP